MNMMFSSSYRCIFSLLTLALFSICISPVQAESPFKNPLGNPYIQDVIEASVESEQLEDALTIAIKINKASLTLKPWGQTQNRLLALRIMLLQNFWKKRIKMISGFVYKVY